MMHRFIRGRYLASVALFCTTGCVPSWPADEFPTEAKVERTLYSVGEYGLREACEAIVVELTNDASTRLSRVKFAKGAFIDVPPAGWMTTPMPIDQKAHRYFEGAFGGCNNRGSQPLGDLPGALQRPGAFYTIVNNGEGIAIIVPRAKLAGYYYFG